MKFIKRYSFLFIVLALSFWAIKPLFIPGFFPIHDDTQVARVFEMGKVLGQGTFPVRWVPDLGYGYGYPLFNFYAPLAYYVGGVFTLFGFDALVATKITMGIGIISSAVFMYLLAKSMWGEIGGAVSALFYVYAPYHAIDIYVRGDIAEFWAYAFIPLVFYSLFKLEDEAKWRYVVIGSLGYAGIILSHNLTALMVTPFILLFILTKSRSKNIYSTLYALYPVILGIALSAFYSFPALLEMKYTNVLSQIGGGADFRNHFVCLNQLWESQWGFGGSQVGCIDGLSFRVGKIHLIAVLLFLATFSMRRLTHKFRNVIIFSMLGFAISIFFMLENSQPLWEATPFMAFFQYPWRFLLLVSFFSSVLAGAIFQYVKPRIASYGIAVSLIALLFFNIKLFQPQTIINKNAQDYTNEIALKWIASKTSDEYLPKDVQLPHSISQLPQKDDNYTKNFQVTVENQKELFAKFYKTLPQLIFLETNTEKIGDAISFFSLATLIAGIIYIRKVFL